jgi:hypothetical protein
MRCARSRSASATCARGSVARRGVCVCVWGEAGGAAGGGRCGGACGGDGCVRCVQAHPKRAHMRAHAPTPVKTRDHAHTTARRHTHLCVAEAQPLLQQHHVRHGACVKLALAQRKPQVLAEHLHRAEARRGTQLLSRCMCARAAAGACEVTAVAGEGRCRRRQVGHGTTGCWPPCTAPPPKHTHTHAPTHPQHAGGQLASFLRQEL